MPLTDDLLTDLRSFEVSEGHLNDAALTRFINRSYTRLYTFITTAFPKRFETSDTVAITAGTTTGFALPSDFWYATAVEIADSRTPTGYSSIERINRNERNDEYPSNLADVRDLKYDIRGSNIYPYPPTETSTLRIWYIPTEPSDPTTILETIPAHVDWLLNDVLHEYAISTEQESKTYQERRQEAQSIMTAALSIPMDNADCIKMTSRRIVSRNRYYPWS